MLALSCIYILRAIICIIYVCMIEKLREAANFGQYSGLFLLIFSKVNVSINSLEALELKTHCTSQHTLDI